MYFLKIYLTALAAVLAFSSFANTSNNEARKGYIEQHKGLAISQMYTYNIPASIVLAQALLETGNGTGRLALNANNHFGIKCKSDWVGDTYSLEDDDYVNGRLTKSCFRAYPSVDESYEDYGRFLYERTRYQVLFSYGKDYKKWAYGLKEAGYATASNYAENLIRIIEENQLYENDFQQHLIPPVIRKEYTQRVSEDSSDILANSNIESTTTEMRKPKEVFGLSTPVTRQYVKELQSRHELIPTVTRTEVATLPDQRVICESPAEPISQVMRLRSFARR